LLHHAQLVRTKDSLQTDRPCIIWEKLPGRLLRMIERLRDDYDFKTIVKQLQEEKAAMRAQVKDMEGRGELTL